MATDRKPEQVVEAVPAASVILVRDGADGLEVLVMERHQTMGFAAGAVVFPGGKIDEGDRDPALTALAGGEGADHLFAYRIGAIRELFEEAGILLAEGPKGDEPDLDFRRKLAAQYRAGLIAGEIGLGDVARRESLRLRPDSLIHFAHWITPVQVPRRFDTQFFLAPVPETQSDLIEGDEAVAMGWRRPLDLLEAEQSGAIGLMFPTRLNLEILAGFTGVEETLASATAGEVVTVMPEVVIEDDELYVEIPEAAGYGRSRYRRSEVFESRFIHPGGRGRGPQ